MSYRVFVGTDHAGATLVTPVSQWLDAHGLSGHPVLMPKASVPTCTDYPLIARATVHAMQHAQHTCAEDLIRGILLCGSGQGMAMAANRLIGIRAAVCTTPEMAFLARAHNNANIITLGARVMTVDNALACLEVFFQTPFEGERHARRVAMLDDTISL